MNVGFTYEIRDKTNPDLVYYGSSELPTLEDRMKIHIQDFNAWKKNNKNDYYSSFKILELNNYKPTLLKIVFFTIKWELHEQERKLIEGQVCVNKVVPNRTMKEWREANKEQVLKQKAEWNKANPNYHKEYYQANKEKQIQYGKEYYQANKEYYKAYHQKYYLKKKQNTIK